MFENGNYPFFRTSDVGRIRKGSIFSSVDFLNKKGIKGLKIFQKGTILFPKSGASTFLNHRVIMEVDGYVSSHLATIKANSHLVSEKFLLYFLFTIDTKDLMQDISYPSLKISDIASIKIPLPPLPEQHRIVSILDECFSAIDKAKANAEQNLKNAKELFESYLQGVFGSEGSPTEENREGWIEKCLDELGTITSSKRIYKSEYVKDGVPFYRTKEIKEISNGKPISLELFISNARYNEIKKTFGVPKIGDLLLSAVGTIGEIMVVDNEDEFYFKDGNIVWFKGFESLDTNYLKYTLSAFVEKIKSLAIGAAYNALTIERLNKYKVSFPKSKAEQQRIVRQLDALRTETKKLEAIYQKKIANLEELKKNILTKAFSGELIETK